MTVRLTAGAPPVPVRVTDCGLPVALSLMATVAVRVPGAVGAKVTLIVQLPPAATELPQLLLWLKSPALLPANTRLVMPKAAFPELVSRMAWAALVVPTV